MIDPAMMATALVTSIAAPVIVPRILRTGPLATFLIATIIGAVSPHLAFWARHSGEHVGPAYAVAIGMYLVIAMFVVGVTMALARVWHEDSREGRNVR